MKGEAIRIILRICGACAFILVMTVIAVTVFAANHKQTAQTADAIVVLGAGMSPDGTLHNSTLGRVQKGIALYKDGIAPRLHFSGGRAVPNGPSAGARMANVAMTNGVPLSAISFEERSLSTLQNALFSKPMLANASSIILVSEGFHLPRAKASFWWMGYDNIHMAHSDRFRLTSSGNINPKMLGREALAYWFNLARAIAWSITGGKHDHILQ